MQDIYDFSSFEYRNPLLTIGVGTNAVNTINCMFNSNFEHVNYLLIYNKELADYLSPIDNQIIIEAESVNGINTQIKQSEIDRINDKFLRLSKYIDFIIVGIDHFIDNEIIPIILSREYLCSNLTVLLVIVPENPKQRPDINNIIDEFYKLKNKVHLIIPVSPDFQSNIKELNNCSNNTKTDYIAKMILKTIINFSFNPKNYINTQFKDLLRSAYNSRFGFFSIGEAIGVETIIDAFNYALKFKEDTFKNYCNAEHIIMYIECDRNFDNFILNEELRKFLEYLSSLEYKSELNWSMIFKDLDVKIRIAIIGTGFDDISTLI